MQAERDALARRLDESRAALLRSEREHRALSERLANLPTLRETLKRYQQAGVEDRLRDQSLVVREEQVFRAFGERLQRIDEAVNQLDEVTPIDAGFLADAVLKDLPARAQLEALRAIVGVLDKDIFAARKSIEEALVHGRTDARALHETWSRRKSDVQAQYERILRELHKSKIDGEELFACDVRLKN